MNPESLTWRLLTAEELTNVYLNEMRRDFPAGELKPLSMILNSEAAGTAHTWGVYEDDALVAYLLMVRPVGCEVSQLDYFAVLPEYRAAGLGAQLLADLPDRRPRHRALRLPFPRSAGLHTLPVLRVPHLHRCAQRPAVLAAGWPCGPWHLDLCVLPWALHPVLRSDVLPEGAAIQTEQLRNPAASNHTLRGSFLLLPLSRK